MAKILLIRHGESVKKDGDTVLTDLGEQQAEQLARHLARLSISKIYVSDYTRALQTLSYYTKLHSQVPVIKTERLREIYRILVGGPVREGTPVNRETLDKVRADAFWDQLVGDVKPNDTVALFVHGNIIRYYLAKVMNVDPKKSNLWEGLQIFDASISVIEINEQKKITAINDVHFLDVQKAGTYFE